MTGSRGKQRRLPLVLHQLICWPTVYQTFMPAFSPSQRPFLRDTKEFSVYIQAQHALVEQERIKMTSFIAVVETGSDAHLPVS